METCVSSNFTITGKTFFFQIQIQNGLFSTLYTSSLLTYSDNKTWFPYNIEKGKTKKLITYKIELPV